MPSAKDKALSLMTSEAAKDDVAYDVRIRRTERSLLEQQRMPLECPLLAKVEKGSLGEGMAT